MSTATEFVQRISDITQRDLDHNHSVSALYMNTVEELGEFAAALTIERGIKKKPLGESSQHEAVDFYICVASLYFASGGSMAMMYDFDEIIGISFGGKVMPGAVDEKFREAVKALGYLTEVGESPTFLFKQAFSLELMRIAHELILATGLSNEEMVEVGMRKLNKWEARLPAEEEV